MLWRMPEMVAPRALVFRPLVKGNEALGTRLRIKRTTPIRRARIATNLYLRTENILLEMGKGWSDGGGFGALVTPFEKRFVRSGDGVGGWREGLKLSLVTPFGKKNCQKWGRGGRMEGGLKLSPVTPFGKRFVKSGDCSGVSSGSGEIRETKETEVTRRFHKAQVY